MPTLYIIAVPNGVGKTTFADFYLPEEAKQLEFVNADLIARGISPYDPNGGALEAGRYALSRIKHLIAQRQGFTWETTMSGISAAVWLKDAKAKGYIIKCYFLWVRDAEVTLARIRQRVLDGGHNIEPDVVRRRFFKTITNFFVTYRHLMDTWKFYANNDLAPRLIAVQKGGRVVARDQSFLTSVLAEIGVEL
ncbi:MAG: Zeta toxin family protein [Verrucomicrobia bacterium]|nr:Zeta toxin family protein [Verrucomicrobiota bacterium]